MSRNAITVPMLAPIIGLFLFGFALTLGALYLSTPLFQSSAIAASIVAIVAFVVLVRVAWQRNTRTPAHIPAHQAAYHPEDVVIPSEFALRQRIAALPPGPDGADALQWSIEQMRAARERYAERADEYSVLLRRFEDGLNRIAPPASNPPPTTAVNAPDFADVAFHVPETPVPVLEIPRIEVPELNPTAPVFGVDMGRPEGDETVRWPISGVRLRAEAEAAKNATLSAAVEVVAGRRPKSYREVMQENRDRYWAERAEVLAEQGGEYVQSMFAEVLGAIEPAPGAVERARLAFAAIIEGPATPPLLLTDAQGLVSTESALALAEAHRDHATRQAAVLEQQVTVLADEVSRLRGRVIGQIGMAAAAQARANEEAIDPEAPPSECYQSIRAWLEDMAERDGDKEVLRVLVELGWIRQEVTEDVARGEQGEAVLRTWLVWCGKA